MKVLNGYVVVEPDKPEEKTSSGILLAEKIKSYPPYGTVKHVAPEIIDIKPGDRVVYKVYASVDIEGDLAVVPYSGIIAILE